MTSFDIFVTTEYPISEVALVYVATLDQYNLLEYWLRFHGGKKYYPDKKIAIGDMPVHIIVWSDRYYEKTTDEIDTSDFDDNVPRFMVDHNGLLTDETKTAIMLGLNPLRKMKEHE